MSSELTPALFPGSSRGLVWYWPLVWCNEDWRGMQGICMECTYGVVVLAGVLVVGRQGEYGRVILVNGTALDFRSALYVDQTWQRPGKRVGEMEGHNL